MRHKFTHRYPMMAKVKVITLKGREKSGSNSLRLANAEFKRVRFSWGKSSTSAIFIIYSPPAPTVSNSSNGGIVALTYNITASS
jgi:hypothetical protein